MEPVASDGRRHVAAASDQAAVDDRFLIIDGRVRIPKSEFIVTYSKSSGPGGQNVNKVSSKATVRWSVRHSPSLDPPLRQVLLTKLASRITQAGDLLITSQRFRDAPRNLADCLEKLRQLVLAASRRPAVRRRTRPTRAAKEKRLSDKRRRSERKESRRAPGGE